MIYLKNIMYCVLLLIASGNSYSQKNSSVSSIQISSESPVTPVFKGLTTNPVLRIRMYVPPGVGEVSSSIIKVRLNESGLKNIERIETFFNGSEPVFAADNRISTFVPTSITSEIPFEQVFKPGLNYVWFSITLKEIAAVDDKIEFDATAIVDSQGKPLLVKKESSLPPKRIGIAVRKAGDNGVHTYRIPGIITTDKGTLIAVYDIRYDKSGDLPGNIDVGMSRSTDGGKNWSPMKVIMDMGEPNANNGVGDPSILFDPVTKKIWVSALWSKGNRSIAGSQQGLTPDETGQFAMVSSSDDGVTWTQPYSITTQVKNPVWKLFFPGPGNGIAMQDGKIVFPAQYWDTTHMPHSTLVYSEDHGQTWKSGIGAKRNTTESQIVETTPGTLMLNMRDNRGGFRSIATTNSLGKEWLEHHTSYKALRDPVCMASFIKAEVNLKGEKKNILFFSNANSPTARIDITIKASLDLGESWVPSNQLLIDERRTFGYSALTKIDNNTIGLLYEGIRDLYFIRIPVNEIIK
jgi:sialidase-1